MPPTTVDGGNRRASRRWHGRRGRRSASSPARSTCDAAGGVDGAKCHAPASKLEALAGADAEIGVVAGGARVRSQSSQTPWFPVVFVLVVADRRSHARLERPPHRSKRPVGGKPTALVLVVAKRQDQVKSDSRFAVSFDGRRWLSHAELKFGSAGSQAMSPAAMTTIPRLARGQRWGERGVGAGVVVESGAGNGRGRGGGGGRGALQAVSNRRAAAAVFIALRKVHPMRWPRPSPRSTAFGPSTTGERESGS